MQWLKEIKIAIVEKQFKTLGKLCNEVAEFSDVDQMREADHLIKEALLLLKQEQQNLQSTMKKIKTNAKFLEQEKRRSRISTLS